MMKKLVMLVVMLATTFAFSQRVQQNDMQINAGIGFASSWGVPFYGGFDYGVHKDITVGGQVTYTSSSQSVNGFKFDGTWFSIGANGNYHFNTLLEIPNEWDVYAGLTLAYNSFSYNYPDNFNQSLFSASASGIGFAGQIGGRYYFTDKIAVNLEFGGGNITSGGKIGVSFKL